MKRSSAAVDEEKKESGESSDALIASLRAANTELVAQLRTSPLMEIRVAKKKLQKVSVFDVVAPDVQASVLSAAEACMARGGPFGTKLSRCVGAMVGMAVADGLGHNFEFMDVRDSGFKISKKAPYFEYPSETPGGRVFNPLNRFSLQPGQWTDDCSMGLCLADSLLTKGDYDGTNIRTWFWNWWYNGLDNAFKRDLNRQSRLGGGSLSVGLGGNISSSLMDITSDPDNITPRFAVKGEDAGNGSLMRLAPVPIRYHFDVKLAREMAFESSLTTHPGPLAAEACAFYAHAIVHAINRENDAETIVAFLDRVSAEYCTFEGAEESKQVIRRLLRSAEPEGKERCWNWKDVTNGLRIEATLKARGRSYNGYPVSSGYFGAFSIDGLAMSLHCLYTTTSFNEAIAKVVNYCGDADTTGAICAQLAGAFYGYASIDPTWVSWLHPWDNHEIELRGIALFLEGEEGVKQATKKK